MYLINMDYLQLVNVFNITSYNTYKNVSNLFINKIPFCLLNVQHLFVVVHSFEIQKSW